MWRAIGTGLGFALIALAMMALAVGTAGVTPAASGPHGDASGMVRVMPDHGLEIHPNPAEPFTGPMPVP